MSTASAATGPSEVPALTTATVPRGSGSGPRVTARASRCELGALEVADRRDRLVGEPGGQHGAVGVLGVQRAQDRDQLRGRLPGAVHHLGVAGAGRAVEVHAGEAQVSGPVVLLVHRLNLAPDVIRPGRGDDHPA